MDIIIVGAGLGGLTLANALRGSGHRVRVFERDSGPEARAQGYGIGLRASTGLSVLSELGLDREVRASGRPATRFSFLNPSGRTLMTLEPDPSAPTFTLSVPRVRLRGLLLEALAGAEVELVWGARCVGYEEADDHAALLLADGSRARADLIVACDGVRSVIRAQKIGDSARFLGLVSIGGLLPGGHEHPLIAGGSFVTLGRGASFFVQSYAEGGAMIWSLCVRAEEGYGDGDSALRERALDHVAGWHDPIPTLVERTPPEDVTRRPYYDRDPLAPWPSGRVTLLGDAAHPMSPFQGQGANMAMVDALALARALREVEPAAVPGALAGYEREMLSRGRRAVLASRRAASIFHWRGRVARAVRDLGLRACDRMMRWQRHRPPRAEREATQP